MTDPTYGIPVTRFEITELIGDVFSGVAMPRSRLVRIAERRGARSAVMLLLRRLPDHEFRWLDDVWHELPQVEDVYDPWEEP